jgi:hypothetical protein
MPPTGIEPVHAVQEATSESAKLQGIGHRVADARHDLRQRREFSRQILTAAVSEGRRVTYLEINGDGVTREKLGRLLREAP